MADNTLFSDQVVKAQAELFAFVAAMVPFYPQDVQDIVQDINLALFRHEADYDSSRPFKPWLLRVARNRVLNFLKFRHKERVIFDEQAVADYAETFAEEARDALPPPLLDRLNICLKKLSPKDRKLLDMRYSLLTPASGIAQKLGLSARSVQNALSYIRKKLHDCMHRQCAVADDDSGGDSLPDWESLIGECLDFSPPNRKTRLRLRQAIAQPDDCRAAYLAQAEVHFLLVWKYSLAAQVNRSAIFHAKVRRAFMLAAAACLVGAVGGGVWFTAWQNRCGAAKIAATVPVREMPLNQQASPSSNGVAAPPNPTANQKTSTAVAAKPIVAEPFAPPKANKEETMNTRTLAQTAVAAALATTFTQQAKATVRRGAGASAAVVIDTRSCTGASVAGQLIETRSREAVGRTVPVIDTKTPLGTVIMLM